MEENYVILEDEDGTLIEQHELNPVFTIPNILVGLSVMTNTSGVRFNYEVKDKNLIVVTVDKFERDVIIEMVGGFLFDIRHFNRHFE